MRKPEISPVYWTVDDLVAEGRYTVNDLALTSAGTLTSYRVVLGRCLLALGVTGWHDHFGCSSAIHYAVRFLGLGARAAREMRRVANRLDDLPLLRRAGEEGEISWCKLRETVRKATAETEAFWLELCHTRTAAELEVLVSETEFGQVPDTGRARTGRAQLELTELRCQLTPEALQIVERGLQSLCQEAGKMLTMGEALEYLFAERLAEQPLNEEALEKTRREAAKDLQAEETRKERLVREARELAEDRGLLKEERPTWVAYDEDFPASASTETEELWAATTAVDSLPCPTDDSFSLATRAQATWRNANLQFNELARGLTPAQRQDLLRRDGYCCSNPGCPHHLWLEAHHITLYSLHGPTTPENLIILCGRCHKNVHRGLLEISGSPETGTLTFADANGRALDRPIKLERAMWLDSWMGYRGQGPLDSRVAKLALGEG